MRRIDPEFIVTQPFQAGDLVKEDGSQVLRDPTSILTTVGSSIIGNAVGGLFGGGGGSSGGSAPPVYIPTNQQGMDQSFQDAYKQYQNAASNYYGTTNPINQQLLAGQINNPYAPGFQAGANAAGSQYGATANQSSTAANSMFGNAADVSQWMNLDRNGMYANAPQVQAAFNGMMGLANQSNDLYNNLIGYQQGQKGNVQGAANNLYAGGNQILNNAFDPQRALYNQNVQDLTENSRAAQYARGIQSSPYGAAVETDALGRFQNDWQDRQLNRQSSGLSAAQGAYSGAENLNNAWVNNLSGLQTAMDSNYQGLTTAATGMMDNWSQAQANVANTFSGALGRDYQTAAGLGNTAAEMYGASGQIPYAANQAIYGGVNQALQNFGANNQPYLSGLNQLQSNALGYMNFGQGAQNVAYNQNMQNANAANIYGQQFAPAITQGINSIWNSGSSWANPNADSFNYFANNYNPENYG